MDKLKRWLGGATGVLLALSGCDTTNGNLTPKDPSGTDTGNPTSAGEGNAAGGCDEVGRRELSLDTDTELGFSAAHMLALAEGEHAFPIVWQHDAETSSGSLQGTQTTMHVQVTRKAGASAELVDLAPHMSTGVEEGPALGLGSLGVECPDQLEIEVEIELSTEDGALQERFDATLVSSDGLGASWSQSIDFADLNGSLQVSLSGAPAGSHLRPLSVQMTHTSFAIQGSLSAGIEGNDGSVAWSGESRLAKWPEDGDCEWEGVPVAPDAKVFDFSLEDALTAIAGYYPSALTWQSGTSTGLSFALELPEGAGGCASTGGLGQRGIKGKVDLIWSSTDQRIDGRLSMSLRAEPDADGALSRVSVYRDAYLADTVAPDAYEQRFGMHGFDLTMYDVAGLQLSWDVDLQLQHASGSLAVLGGTAPACLTAPPAPIDDGMGGGGAPGCAGIDFDEVEQASF